LNEELEDRHRDFHRALIAACESPTLLNLSQRMYVLTELYRRPALVGMARSRRTEQEARREHNEIVKAALARNSRQACDLLAAHYRKTGSFIEGNLAAEPPRAHKKRRKPR
jgi:DNA-binding GntR family transcriptional regulator